MKLRHFEGEKVARVDILLRVLRQSRSGENMFKWRTIFFTPHSFRNLTKVTVLLTLHPALESRSSGEGSAGTHNRQTSGSF